MATLGYARTSTREQEAGLQAQIRDLIAAGCAERDIYTEQASIMGGIPEIRTDRRPAGLSGAIPKGGPSGGRSERAPCLFVQMARISDFRAVERRKPSGGRVISPETVQAILRPKNSALSPTRGPYRLRHLHDNLCHRKGIRVAQCRSIVIGRGIFHESVAQSPPIPTKF